MKWKIWASALCVSMLLIIQPSTGRTVNLENIIYMDLKDGRVVIELWPDLAPKHVDRIKTLARQKFYDGVDNSLVSYSNLFHQHPLLNTC